MSITAADNAACEVFVIVILPCCTSVKLDRRPVRSVVLLDCTSGVGEPRRYLRQRHLGDDRQHDLLCLGRVRILDVLVEPGFQRGRRLATSCLTPYIQYTIAALQVTTTKVKKVKGRDIYIPPFTGKPRPAAVYNAKWRTDRQ